MTKPCKELIDALGGYVERIPEAAMIIRDGVMWDFGEYSIRAGLFSEYRCEGWVGVHGNDEIVASWAGSSSLLEEMLKRAARYVIERMEESGSIPARVAKGEEK